MMSFYGGRRGSGFTIERSYNSWSDVSAVSDINLGSYFLIRNDDLNGTNAVYKRVNTNQAGYEFVANLVTGYTSSSTPSDVTWGPLQWNSYTDVGTHSADETYSSRNYTGQELVDGSTHSAIRVNSYRDAQNQNHIGLEVPYPVVDFTVDVKPASEITDVIEDITPSGSSPFYKLYQLNIAESSSFKNLRIIKPSDTQQTIYNIDNTAKTFTNDNYIIVYNQDYVDNDTPVSRIYYLGDWNTIDGITLSQAGLLTITDENGQTYTYQFKDISGISFVGDELTVTYKDSTTYTATIRSVTELEYDEDTSEVIATYNTIDENTNEPEQEILYTPNFIKGVKVDDDGHLFVRYSDPNYTAEEPYTGVTEEDGYWIDYGPMIGASGILIGTNYTYLEIAEIMHQTPITREVIIACLKQEYPHGCGIGRGDLIEGHLVDDQGQYITDDSGKPIVIKMYDNISEYAVNAMGKIITVGDTDDKKECYAFDYRKEVWYYIGTIGEEVVAPPNIIIAPVDDSIQGTQDILDELPVGGIWLGIVGDVLI